MRKAERDKFKDKLSWIRNFKKNIAEWRTMLDILQALKIEVKLNGLSEKTKSNFERSISGLKLNTQRLIMVKNEVFTYLEQAFSPKRTKSLVKKFLENPKKAAGF